MSTDDAVFSPTHQVCTNGDRFDFTWPLSLLLGPAVVGWMCFGPTAWLSTAVFKGPSKDGSKVS
ncbi:MAG: hypothetical protein IPK82_08800 [Polyangiaceae bacterium]|nr:hypothetical protein [Polyangiaceae bacterium]